MPTDREFGHCRIRAEFKWGVKRFPPREDDKRDSGLLYYFTGPDKVWPRALELQIQETDVGDLWILEGTRITTKIETEGYPMYVLSGPLRTQSRGRIIKFGDFEDRRRMEHRGSGPRWRPHHPTGEWTGGHARLGRQADISWTTRPSTCR